MLTSKKLELRRSEIRQSLAELASIETPSDDEVRKMGALDMEYRAKETQYRAALIAEDEERRDAGAELETRSGREWSEIMAGFEVRQVAAALDHGAQLTGKTAEIVTELRDKGAYQGIPVPWEALEIRAGETIASGTPDPIQTRPIIDRLFPESVAAKMGAQMINIGVGEAEWPVTTQGASVGWQSSETGSVGAAQAFQTSDKALAPDHTLGVQMKITRKSLKQSGSAMEQAVRRDMQSAMAQEIDRVVFLGSGSSGEPLGIVAGAATYGITATDVSDEPTYQNFLDEIVAFMTANAISNPGQVRALMRPELFGKLEGTLNSVTQTTEYYRLAFLLAGRDATGTFPANINVSANSLAAPTGSPLATSMVLSTSTGGVAPVFVGTWGAVDMIRDPYSDAASGGLRITALSTMDVTVARPAQTRILNDIQLAAGA
ncbi:phage major capsid protein [Primorskyibacter sp. 2E107]|uniref:phage major capsid protein n=1 Tax=Primorskyibacter sp. 2E107 TaxID=3403458 RepID=UPI003AF7D145